MIGMISPAKTFAKKPMPHKGIAPSYPSEMNTIMEQALLMSQEEMAKAFKLSPKMAAEARATWLSLADGSSPEGVTLGYYSGMVFKKVNAKSFDDEDWRFAEAHLRICSFVYGMLTPTTLIRPYRMEGTLRLHSGERVFDFWRDKLTSRLIADCQADDGVLLNLASDEMQQLYHWDEVRSKLRVINFYFETRQPDGSLKTIVVYCKMARGAMMHEVIKRRISNPEELKRLEPEGFIFAPELSSENDWHYILG